MSESRLGVPKADTTRFSYYFTTENEFISGGYFIITRAKRPEYLSPRVPETFVTPSGCLTSVAPDLWAVDWEDYSQQERAEEAAKFGIPASAIAELVEWTTRRAKFPVGFSSFEDAQGFWRLSSDDAVTVIGIGLHGSLVESFKSQLEKESNRVGTLGKSGGKRNAAQRWRRAGI